MTDEQALRAELEEVKRERDRYRTALQNVLGQAFPLTAEDIVEMENNGLTMEGAIRRIKARHGLTP